MKQLLPIATAALICTTGLALAAENPSGRPGQVLDKQQCKQAWKAAGPENRALTEDKATPYVLNFAAVDTSNDRKISAKEWRTACKKGWISADARGVTSKNTGVTDEAGTETTGVKKKSTMKESSTSDSSAQSENSY